MSQTGPCSNGEDLVFLAHCAGAKDFSLLVEGQIQPHYLSPAGKDVATWVIARKSEAPREWPPAYDVLRELFPALNWPALPDDLTGLDPRFAAADVWYSYKTHLGNLIHGQVQFVVESDYDHREYLSRCQAIRDMANELINLQNPTPRPERVGADPERMFRVIMGEEGDKQVTRFEMDMPELQRLIEPPTRGLYTFFGRPKHTKSWRIERNAWFHSIVRGNPSVIVDPENDQATLLRRLACFDGGFDYGAMRQLIRKYGQPDLVLTRDERDMLDQLWEVCYQIQTRSNLVILGKEHIDPETQRIEISRIYSEAKAIGAKVLFCEQIHKYGSPGLSKQATEVTRIHRAVQVLADSDYLVVASTQEKRKDNPRLFAMPEPHEDWVFGGDAVAQNCSMLVHVHRFELNDGSIIIMLTPLLGRDGEPGTGHNAIFVRARFGGLYEILPPEQGRAMAEATLLSKRKERDDASRAAREIAGVGPDPDAKTTNRPPRPGATRGVQAWLGQK